MLVGDEYAHSSAIDRRKGQMSKRTWVNLSEATKVTGYNLSAMRHVAHNQSKLPEEEREIKMRKRSNGWEMWLPDLMAYISKPGRGPKPKRSKTAYEGTVE
jgi:hypothetical protein